MTIRVKSVLRSILCFAAFAITFAAVCHAIHRALPLPEILTVWQKLTHLAERGGDYDTLFIGSSRINYQVMPTLFDELCAAKGVATKSFNAGVPGMRPPEDAFFFDQILATRPARLRWVFVELAGIRANIGEERRGTLRMQYWHDLPRISLLWRHATQLPPTEKLWTPKRLWRELREPLGRFFPHFELFFREQANIGKGDFLAKRLLGESPPPRESLSDMLGENLRGWIPTGRGEEMIPRLRAEFDEELAERRTRPATRDFGDPVSQEALEALIAKIEKAGATAVLIVPPTTSKKNFFPLPEREQKTIVLDFSDPARFPELFEIHHRLDSEHTNTAGSEIFTRLIAQRWLEEMKSR